MTVAEEMFERGGAYANTLYTLGINLAQHAADLEDYRNRMAHFKAAVLCDEEIVTGKNEAIREAQVLLALEGNPTYQDCVEAVRNLNREIGVINAERECLRENLKLVNSLLGTMGP